MTGVWELMSEKIAMPDNMRMFIELQAKVPQDGAYYYNFTYWKHVWLSLGVTYGNILAINHAASIPVKDDFGRGP